MVPCLPPCLLPGLQASVCAAQPGKKFARNSARKTFSRAAVGGVHQYRGVSWPSQALRVGKDGRSPLSSRAAILVHAREPSPAPPLPRSLPSVPRQQSLKQPRKKRKSLGIPGLPAPREREPRGPESPPSPSKTGSILGGGGWSPNLSKYSGAKRPTIFLCEALHFSAVIKTTPWTDSCS